MKFCGFLVVLVFFMTLWSIECWPPFPIGCGNCAATFCPYVPPSSCPGGKTTRDKCGCCTVCKKDRWGG
ncbi:insulin-like growth factor-binding protein 7 [Tachypleus tridentatus]|uniref:insulin-like growth factor-binding protein 7 n=1 Tax=Tachypleus tridentatus TaxID=6853 RepID=UPI003A5D6326